MLKLLMQWVLSGAAALLCPFSVVAQVGDSLQIGRDTCSYFGERLPDQLTTFVSDREAEDVIRSIIRSSGLAPNFDIKAAGVPNAAAVVQGGRRLILYDQYFVRTLTQKAGTRWAAISVMAHEIGHHLNGHTLSPGGSRPKLELEADYYSGFVLQKMGATLEEARRAMEVFGSSSASSTHPARHDRLAAIGNGWTESCSNDPNCGKTNPRPAPKPIPGPPVKPGPDSCQYARDGTCDEPDACDVGTDTMDCKVKPVPPPRPTGFPSGHGMQTCGCWGFNPAPVAAEPRCQSGSVRINICPGFCPTGGSPYAYVCQ
jgi:hypothetical protein